MQKKPQVCTHIYDVLKGEKAGIGIDKDKFSLDLNSLNKHFKISFFFICFV